MKRTAIVMSMLILASAAMAETYPYTGRVTGERVNVRSGPTMTSYTCTQLNTGDRVKVLGTLGKNFLEIEALPFTLKTKVGCLGVVAAKDVTRAPAVRTTQAGWGTINSDDVWVRAGGDLRLSNFDAPQTSLKKGTKVYILGRMVDTNKNNTEVYLIQPPKAARYYIAKEYVGKVASALPALDLPKIEPLIKTEPAPKTAVLDESAPKPEAAAADVVAGNTASTDQSVQGEKAILASLKTLQKRYNAELTKPVAERDMNTLLTDAERMDVPEDSEFRPYYDYVIQSIQRNLSVRRTTTDIDDLVKSALAKSEPADLDTPALAEGYDLQGVLYRSQLYSTRDATRYVVRDPKTRNILGYVESGTAPESLDSYCGKTVQIAGTQAFIKNQSLPVTRVDRINSLTVEPTIAAKLPEGPVIDPGATKLADLPAPPVQEATPRIDVPGVVKDPAGKEMAGMVRDLLDEAGKGETPAATEPEVKHPEEVPSGIEISIVPPEAGSEMPGLPETVTKEPEAKGTIDPTAIELRRLRDALNSTAKAPETTGPSAEELAAKAEDEQRLAALAAAAKAEAEQRDADALAAAKAEAEQRDADALAAAKAEEENRIAELAALAKAEQERRDADAALAVAKAEEENRIATLAAIAKAEQEQRDADAALEAARVKEEQRVAMLAAIAKAEEEQRVAALATAKMEQEQRDADAALAASIAAKLPKVEEKIPEVKVPEVKIPEVDSKGSEFAVKDPEVKIPSLQPKELVKVDPHAPVEPGPIGLEPEVEVAIKIKTPKETAPIEPGPMETKIIEPAGDVIQAAYIETEFEVEWD